MSKNKPSEPLYKWLTADNRTAVQGTPWPTAVGEWTKPETPVLCESGWHAMYEKDVLTHLPDGVGAKLWRVEVRGTVVEGDDKIAATSMRLLYCLGETTDSNLRLFACDVAEDALRLIDKPDPRSVAAIEVARRYAVGDATSAELYAARGAARDAARDAARGAAWDAAWDAARGAAWGAARGAAWDAARYAAGAAWDAAGAAWDAAGCAAWARYSNWLVVRIESGY